MTKLAVELSAISREDVRQAYLELLGREPESEATVAAYQALPRLEDVHRVILESPEYAERQKQPVGKSASVFFSATDKASALSVVLLGNCQVVGLAQLVNAMSPQVQASALELTPSRAASFRTNEELREQLLRANQVWVQPYVRLEDLLPSEFPNLRDRVRVLPSIDFLGFHPDCVYIERRTASGQQDGWRSRPQFAQGPLGDYHSSMIFWAWTQGWSVERTLTLFHPAIFSHLGYTGQSAYWQHGIRSLVLRGLSHGLPMSQWISRWERHGVWMHSVNHPKLAVLADLARHYLAGLVSGPFPEAESVVQDHLSNSPCWPLYPSVAEHLGFAGNYNFKKGIGNSGIDRPVQFLGLSEMVAQSFAAYEQHPPDSLTCSRLQTREFQSLGQFLDGPVDRLARRMGTPRVEGPIKSSTATGASQPGRSPYAALPGAHFWRLGVARVPASEVDPVVSTRFKVSRNDRVATAGSCFAQHIAKTLASSGFLHWVVEQGNGLSAEQRERGQYGVYSARYGNVYSARQLLQLTELAYAQRRADDLAWQLPDGRWVDPLRPAVEPEGWASSADMLASRNEMLKSVRTMLEGCAVFVFTLGLTEVWRRDSDGLVLPLPPGAVTPLEDPAGYGFVNLSADEVRDDLAAFLRWLHALNPSVRVILTVSPVPLIATYERDGVLQANTYSKSALRVAAQRLRNEFSWVDYFPSYEIITGQFHGGAYYKSDLRSVQPEGVDHVMRVFMRHYSELEHGPKETKEEASEWLTRVREVSHIVCDEEALDPGSPGRRS